MSILFFFVLAWGPIAEEAYALVSPHPVELYDKGRTLLDDYKGSPTQLYEAQKYFVNLIEKFPESPFGYLGMSRLYKINAYLYDSRYKMSEIRDLALPFAVKALELGPSIRDVHENYTHFEQIFEQFHAYKEHIQQYLTLFPDQAETYFVVATFILEQNEYEKALDYYHAALEMEPASQLRLKILKRIAYIYLTEYKQPEKAVKYYEEALEIKKDSPVLNEYLGLAYLQMDDYKLAIERFLKALDRVKTSFPEYHLLEAQGYLAEKEGKIEEAIHTLEQACSFGFPNSILHYRLGNIYYKAAKFEDAYNHFKKVIDIEPQDPDAYYFAARSAHSLGKTDQALSYFKQYLQLNASSQEADWIRANIPELSQVKIHSE